MKSGAGQPRNGCGCDDMARLHIIVEGETEEDFVNQLLARHLYRIGYVEVSARLMGRQRPRRRRGGIRHWPEAQRDIINHLRQDTGVTVSTLVDYYGMPSTEPGVWPGRATAGNIPPSQKGEHVERAMLADVTDAMGHTFNPGRFVPYVMMHEFEAMLFSDCDAFARAIGHAELGGSFQQMRESFNTPEEINDSPETAPSKRILASVPNYQKPLLGVAAASQIGLAVIRRECPHFGQWLTRLENLIALATV